MEVIWNSETHPKTALTIAVGGPWIDLNPGMQHTMWADIVMSNQYEALVAVSESGVIFPLAAKSWEVSGDFKEYIFTIDRSRRYSDGSRLNSVDFKRSWEDSLRMIPKSANRGGQDIFGFIEGYDRFTEANTLSGVTTPNEDTLQVRFARPYRMALRKLAGNRFAAFKQVQKDKAIGTGRYVIEEISKTELKLQPNLNFIDDEIESSEGPTLPLNVKIVPTIDAYDALKQRTTDALAHAQGGQLSSKILADPSIQIRPGRASIHDVMILNNNKGAIFAKKELRWAAQSLITKIAGESQNRLGDRRLYTLDAQVYLPLQAGRLSDEDVDQHLTNGARLIEQLKIQSKKTPIKIYYGPAKKWILPLLEQEGITIATDSRQLTSEETISAVYRSHDYDAVFAGFSVVTGDPDGIYHMLGRNGGILCPVAYREAVGELLEQGRELIHPEELDAFYKKVSHAILDEVPFVHFGFNHSAAVYSKDRVRVGNFDLQRSEGHFNIFRPK